jgi:hypothetical protein
MSLLIIVVAREDVERGNVSPTIASLGKCVETAQRIFEMRETVELTFDGYSDDHRALYEILEVRHFVQKLDIQFPYWLYFLTKEGDSLSLITRCFLPPFLTTEARLRIFPEELDKLLARRWVPAVASLCQRLGMTNADIDALISRAQTYLESGPV